MSKHYKKMIQAFTLIEVMVVIVIIGIVTTIAVLMFSGFTDEQALKSFGSQLSSLARTARIEALLEPAVIGLSIKQHQYQFYRFDSSAKKSVWKKITQGPLANSVSVPSDVTITVHVDHAETDDNNKQPQILFLPSGDITSFTITVSNRAGTLLSISNKKTGLPVLTVSKTRAHQT